ncbi:MAG: DNA methyltransferase [Rhodospirillales bacterium]|nr:MAG: DNA methyltransferase [Rhodospirillales bacterium]TVR96400.1 MAG: DNA methyltransferase [Rhodospirillales bacterium]
MNAPHPSKRYRVIYADPPWTFATFSRKGKGRSPEAYYDCMTLADIQALPVADWAADDCVLLLWATDPLLDKALEVIRAWGFTYKTVGFYWAKLQKCHTAPDFDERSFFTGLGFWTRANPEPCLLATRGHPKRVAANVRKLVIAPRREHSRKPDEVYGRIEALCQGPYLEMFARSSRPGWDSWGIETGLLDRGGAPQRRWRADSYPEAAE